MARTSTTVLIVAIALAAALACLASASARPHGHHGKGDSDSGSLRGPGGHHGPPPAAGHGPHHRGGSGSGHHAGPPAPPTKEEVEAVLTACKDQAAEVCPKPEDDGDKPELEEAEDADIEARQEEVGEEQEEEHKRPPVMLLQCLKANEAKLTGECAAAVEKLPVMPRHHRGPMMALRRECGDDVEDMCAEGEDAQDVVQCLLDALEEELSEECAEVVDHVREHKEHMEEHGAAGDESEVTESTQPPAVSYSEFMAMDPEAEDEEAPEGMGHHRGHRSGHGHRRPRHLFVIGGIVAGVVVVVGVIVAIVVVRRRRRRARQANGQTFSALDDNDDDVQAQEPRVVTAIVLPQQGQQINYA